MSAEPEIKRLVEAAKPGMKLKIEQWRPIENLQSGEQQKIRMVRITPLKGAEALIDSEEKESDVVLNNGIDALCGLAFQSGGLAARFNWTAIGTDATAPARAQSNLIAEVMRNTATYTKDAPAGEASIDSVFNIAVSGYALNEISLANISGVNLSAIHYCRDTYATKNTISGDTVNSFYTASFSGA